MAYVEHDGGSSAGVVAIFVISLIVLLLIVLFFGHPFHLFTTTVSPASSGAGAGASVHASAPVLPSTMASPSHS